MQNIVSFAKETYNLIDATNRSHRISTGYVNESSHIALFLMGTVSTVQDLLDWFEVDLGFTKLLFIQTDLCVLCVFVFYSLSFPSCPFLDILRCLPRVEGVPLESALNLASRMSPCGAMHTRIRTNTHAHTATHKRTHARAGH